MKTTTAKNAARSAATVLYNHGWTDAPDASTAARMLRDIYESGDDTLNGEELTSAERRALRVLAEE